VVTALVGPSAAAVASSSAPLAPAHDPASAPIDLSAGLAVLVVALAVIGGFSLGVRRRS
jgi:hypothetical protein